MEITTFKPTLLQRILGKHYKWWYFLFFYFNRSMIYKWNYLAMVLRYMVPTGIFLALFYITGSAKSSEYFLIASLVFYFFTLPMNISYEMKDGVLQGKYTRQLLLPVDPQFFYLMQSIGMLLVPFLLRIFIFSSLLVIFQVSIRFEMSTIITFLYALIFGNAICFVNEFLIGNTSFWLPDNKFLIQGYQDATQFMSGAIIPLTSFLTVFTWLPYSFAVYHPMQIYLGKYDTNQTLLVFAGGVGWCLLLYVLAQWVFKIGLKRNEAVGL
jgi:ABC-2 type transport system permease protein